MANSKGTFIGTRTSVLNQLHLLQYCMLFFPVVAVTAQGDNY